MRKIGATEKVSVLIPFDIARYLTDDYALTEYAAAAIESNEIAFIALARADIARASDVKLEAQPDGGTTTKT